MQMQIQIQIQNRMIPFGVTNKKNSQVLRLRRRMTGKKNSRCRGGFISGSRGANTHPSQRSEGWGTRFVGRLKFAERGLAREACARVIYLVALEAALDVHAPHHPIGGWKDFFVHLVTISIGLLIAVGIEGCVELHREHKLVREARETMREEIQYNPSEMKKAVAKLDQQMATMKKNIDTLTRIQENPKDKEAQNSKIDADFSIVGLRETAWKTAQTTGALSFMPYAESQRYSEVYGSQQEFLDQQNKILEDEAQFVGLMAKTNFGHTDITAEQAGLALERFGVWRAHLAYLDLMAKVTAANDAAFLVGKEGPHEMHMELGGGGK